MGLNCSKHDQHQTCKDDAWVPMGAAVSRELVGAAKVGCPMRAIGFGAYRGRGIGGDEPDARRQRGERLPMGRAGHWTLAMVRWVTARRKSWRSPQLPSPPIYCASLAVLTLYSQAASSLARSPEPPAELAAAKDRSEKHPFN